MPRRYNTEIRGDGATVRLAWPSEHEVAITFAEPPPVGRIYQVEFVAS
ncbi:MAG: hypothetical protein M3008_13795 [Chloroflexota bacterium]|nr:hypothetical protein [Chloroflexota bacterium]